jgi:DHA1 family bicyclomycin/chloramphenicol resistance-like MFS transporter
VSPNPPAPGEARLVANLVGQLALGLLAMTICLPSMPSWAAQFDASQAMVQATFAGYVATYGVLQLVYGAVSDRIGRKPVLLVGIGIAALASFLAAAATELWMLVAARALQGAGCAAGMVIGRALVQDLFHGAERTRVMAFVGMTMGLCPPFATIVGGQLHVRLGWQANFVFIGLLALALLVAAWRGLPDRPPAAPSGDGHRGLLAGYAVLAREPAFVCFVLILAMSSATFYAFLGGTPIVLAGYGVTPERLGFYLMAPPLAYIAGNALTARLLRAGRDDHQLMIAGQASVLAGLSAALGLGLLGVHTPLALTLPMLMLGLGHGLLMAPTLTGTVGLVPALAGSAAAVAGLMQQLVGALGGYAVGLVSLNGPVHLVMLMLGTAACGALAQAVLIRRYRSRPRPVARTAAGRT